MRHAIAALLIATAATATPAAAEPREPALLLDMITLWLAANFHLPASAKAPDITIVPNARLVEMRYGLASTIEPGQVVAVYDDVARTIYLGETWDSRTPAGLSVLVHEMVHHLQAASGQRFACPGEREKIAYQAQDAWLRLFGESLDTTFGIEPAMVLVATVCTH